MFLGIDCGTQGTKAIVLDAVSGVSVVCGTMIPPLTFPK